MFVVLHVIRRIFRTDFIAKGQKAKEIAEAVLEQIALIKKSILARAFRSDILEINAGILNVVWRGFG